MGSIPRLFPLLLSLLFLLILISGVPLTGPSRRCIAICDENHSLSSQKMNAQLGQDRLR